MVDRKSIDFGSSSVIAITLILFALALFTKGITHDLLLESGVFLVSVKLIMLAYKSNVMKQSIENKLDTIHAVLLQIEERNKDPGALPNEEPGSSISGHSES